MILRGFTVYDIMGTDNPGVISFNNLTCSHTEILRNFAPHSSRDESRNITKFDDYDLGSRNNYLQDSSWNLISTCFDIQLFNFD